MKTSRFTTEQIVAILEEHVAGASPADLIRRHGISRPTFYHWKKRYGDLQVKGSQTPEGARGGESPHQAARRRPSAQSPDPEGRPGKRAMTTVARRAVVQRLQGRYSVGERVVCCRQLNTGHSGD